MRATIALRRLAPLLPIALISALASAGCMSPAEAASAPLDEHSHAVEESGFADPKPVTVLEAQKPKASDGPVVVIVLDGARWQDVFGGADPTMAAPRGFNVGPVASGERLMPNLHALIARGVAIGGPDHGEPFRATGPNFVSLPGYMELFSGQKPDCMDNRCPRTRKKTIVDEVRESLATSVEDVAVITSWPAIEHAATTQPTKIVMSTGVKHNFNSGALRFDRLAATTFWSGEQAFPFPGEGDYRPDALTARIATSYLAKKRPRFMFLGLGDMDEYAHKNDYRDYVLALQAADRAIGDVVATLDAITSKSGDGGKRPTIVVTADHGRADDFRSHGEGSPESARSWLVMSGGNVPEKGFVDAKKPYFLRDIAPTLRVLMGLPSKSGHGAGEPIEEVVGD